MNSTIGDQLDPGLDTTSILNVKQSLYRFDSILRLTIGTAKKSREHGALQAHDLLMRIHATLKQGLNDRVNLISLFAPESSPCGLGSATLQSGQKIDITVGLVTNSNNVGRTVDRGPPAENKAAAALFRDFWGEKAELRRFKDGSILESVVWDESENAQPIVEQIIQHVLQRHVSGNVEQTQTRFETGFRQYTKRVADTSAFDPLMKHLNQFENDLRERREMPLSIRQIMPADEQLRFSSIRAPPHGKAARKPIPANVTLQFEGSGRWPDDLAAIQRTKIAFMLKLEQLFRESPNPPSIRIGLENEEESTLNQAFLEVTYDSEATFRLRIYHDREQALLERQLKNPSIDPRSKEVAAMGLARYKRDYVKTPAHTQAVARLCSRHPALSGSIRLTKRWFSSHLLHNHIPDEIIELLVARTFTQPHPWQAPSSPRVGFLRTLFWLSRWDWRVDPLIVDLSGSGNLKNSEVKAIRTRFEAWRKLDPAFHRVTLFAASNVDPDGTTWTDGQPAKVVAGRMVALAKSACAEVDSHGLDLDVASLFTSALTDFDFVLHLNPKFVVGAEPRPKKAAGKSFKNLEFDETDALNIGFDPVEEFVRDLEAFYRSALVFFYGASERLVIGGLWSPETSTRSWKVNLAYSTVPARTTPDGDQVDAVLNKTATLSEIARLGGDLITKIDVNR